MQIAISHAASIQSAAAAAAHYNLTFKWERFLVPLSSFLFPPRTYLLAVIKQIHFITQTCGARCLLAEVRHPASLLG